LNILSSSWETTTQWPRSREWPSRPRNKNWCLDAVSRPRYVSRFPTTEFLSYRTYSF